MGLKYTEANYSTLLDNIRQAFEAGAFKKNYIESITFPYYKNLQPYTTINFTFPFTVFVGKNGSGKSSTLHALYGCPHGYSTGNFWFSTHLDPIIETGDSPNCYFYMYEEDGVKKTVLKTRVTRSASETHRKNPDYWEPSRPLKKYGLDTRARYSPIEKDVVYMDFRSELSAFDQFFYFGELNSNLSSPTKQDYIRFQSKKLKSAIEMNRIYKIGKANQNESVIELKDIELEFISYILGKEYTAGKIIRHKFFGNWGTSVILEHDSIKYSEAHAGSGEIAVVKLVHTLLNSKDRSLILLDEPEVSLHPGAQRRLKIFLMQLLLSMKHQIIISTHSPTFVEGLPKESIKLFTNTVDTDKVRIIENCYPNEAFFTLGQFTSDKVNIIVEDELARNIVSAVISTLGEEKHSLFNVSYYPGGAQTIKKSLVKHYAIHEDTNTFVIFDGDQKPECEVLNLEEIPISNYNTTFLGQHIKEITNISNVEFDIDGNSTTGGRVDQLLDAQVKYIRYYRSNIYYLPRRIPEEIIWDEDFVLSLISDREIAKRVQDTSNFKDKMKLASDSIFRSIPNSVESLSNLLINRWVHVESTEKKEITDIVLSILEKKEGRILSVIS
jgi:predicted ATPase